MIPPTIHLTPRADALSLCGHRVFVGTLTVADVNCAACLTAVKAAMLRIRVTVTPRYEMEH